LANILFVDQYAVMGGAQRILVDLAHGFVRAGHEVEVLLPGEGVLHEILHSRGVKTGSYWLPPLTSGSKGAAEKAGYLLSAPRVARSIREAAGPGFDLMYINGPRAMLPGVFATKRLRVPAVAAVHLIHEGIEQSLLEWCFRKPQVRLVSFCSQAAAQPFANLAARAAVIPNWVAPEFLSTPSRRSEARAALGLSDSDLALGVLGRVSKTKGQRQFLEAAAPLLAQNPGLRLFLAGGADFEDPEEEISLRREFGDRATFLEKTEAISFLDALDVCVVPSMRPEAFGLVAVEGMARRLPVIATGAGGHLETIEHERDGLLVEPTADSLRSALTRLISDAHLRARLGTAGAAKATSQFNPEVLIPRAIQAILAAAKIG